MDYEENLAPHKPTPEQAVRIGQMREAAWHFQDIMLMNCPGHPKLDRALLLLAESLHNANRAVLESEKGAEKKQ